MATVAETLHLDGELASQFLARLPHVVAAVLIVLIGFQAALLVARLAGPPASETLAPVAPAPLRNVIDVPSIMRANLFGQAPPSAGGGTPVTSMQLVLGGVVAAADEKLGVAMIGATAGNIEIRKVGDPLPGGAKLHAVHVDRVLLDRNGTIEALVLPALVPTGAAQPPQPPAGNAATIARIEQSLRGNPGAISQVMQRTLVIDNGRMRGVRVSPGPNAAAFTRLGLRNGDVVTAINGVELNDEARSREIFDSLSGSAEARVTVDRNGTSQELTLNLADIAPEAEQIATAPVEPPAMAAPPGVVPGGATGAPPPAPPPGTDPESTR